MASNHVRMWLMCASLVGLVCCAPQLHAQATIDPTLPTAPLIHQRVLHIFPGYDTVANPNISVPPLTSKQKWEIFVGRAFDFSMPVEAAFFAAGSQAVNYSPHYGTDGTAYLERFGAYAGSITSSSFFADFALPVAFHQDPRYFRRGRGSIPRRIWYAVSQQAVGHTDDGRRTFNSSGLLGFGLSSAVSNIYYPRNNITFGNNMERFGVKVGISMFLNFTREFGGRSQP